MALPYQDRKYTGTMTSSCPNSTPPTHPWSFHLINKIIFLKNGIKLDFLPLERLHNIGIWNTGLVHSNKLKLVLVRLKQHHTFICAFIAYELKYPPFDYYNHYEHIKYTWTDRHKGPHNTIYKWGEDLFSNVTWPLKTIHPIQHLNCILNKCHYKNQHTYTRKFYLYVYFIILLYKIIMRIIVIDVFYHNTFY